MGIRYTLRKATQSLRFSSVIPACGNDWTTVFMIHKRELSDSMIESGSSLFYCIPHHQQNPDRVFRSAGIFLSGFLYRFFLNPFGVVSASELILLKGQASADIRPPAHVALTIIILARRDDRSVRFQAYRVILARRNFPFGQILIADLITALERSAIPSNRFKCLYGRSLIVIRKQAFTLLVPACHSKRRWKRSDFL